MTPLFQGEPYSEFKEEWDDELIGRPIPVSEAIRLINAQTEIVEEALNRPLKTSTNRRQCVVYMLEQCILVSCALQSSKPKERRRSRMLRRLLERVRRVARGDGL
jgi:hypothetical protein